MLGIVLGVILGIVGFWLWHVVPVLGWKETLL